VGRIKKVIKHTVSAVVHPGAAKEQIRLIQKRRATNARRHAQYLAWYAAQELTPSQLAEQKKAAAALAYRPLVSILVPTYNTNPKHLRECLDSVLAQTYDNWELCIADDKSPSQETRDVIKEYAQKHKNIKYVFSDKNQHIALTSNLAMTLAKGEYISLLDHDDLLLPHALYETVKVINEHRDADLIYSDEDKLEDDRWHVEPFFKPDWSPDFLRSCNYITHFATLSSKIMKQVKGFTIGTEGAQDWDLFLRVTAQTDRIYHIPKILYTWRKSRTSTAQSADSKPYAYVNQKKVLRRNLGLQHATASVEAHRMMGFWRTRYQIQGTPLVSIIIPNKDSYELITQCVNSILEDTTYPYFEVIVVENNTTDARVEEFYEKTAAMNDNFRIIRFDKKPFNYSAVCNAGASKAKGEYLVFLNNDTELISHDWLQGLLEHAQRPEVGMVGAKLLFPNFHIQHAGVVLSGTDIAIHAFYGQDPQVDIFTYIYAENIRNCAAVTAACAMVSTKKFKKAGGFDEKLRVTYNDVDLCLRMLDAGYLNVYTPFVELFHHESVSVGKITTSERNMEEVKAASALMHKRWDKYLMNDPFYNPNFIATGRGYELK